MTASQKAAAKAMMLVLGSFAVGVAAGAIYCHALRAENRSFELVCILFRSMAYCEIIDKGLLKDLPSPPFEPKGTLWKSYSDCKMALAYLPITRMQTKVGVGIGFGALLCAHDTAHADELEAKRVARKARARELWRKGSKIVKASPSTSPN